MVDLRTLTAVIGLTLTAVTLTGSTGKPATSVPSNRDASLAGEVRRGNDAGRELYSAGKYLEARATFLSTGRLAERAGDLRAAAMNWNNAGGSALARLDYRDALTDFLKARQIAQASGKTVPLAMTMNNLASLYLEMDNPAAAMQVATEALAGPAGSAGRSVRPKLRFQLASALSGLHRFDEADGIYRAAAEELEEQEDFDSCARILGDWGIAALEANRPEEADATLSRALLLVRLHHLNAEANILRGLAKVRSRQGDMRSAAALFDAAVASPPGLTPRWLIYGDRGQFRLDREDLRGALADFREARRLALRMRAEIVPADDDRVSLESALSRVSAGFVEAGNRLARRTSDRALLKETFDAAEQDRIWSLRALVPAADDWRARLPENYWDLLARYQSAERAWLARPSTELQERTAALELKLQEIEAAASTGRGVNPTLPALAYAQGVLDRESVLFSFYLNRGHGWLWAIDRKGAEAFPVEHTGNLRSRVAAFARATREGSVQAVPLGRELYRNLFGAVPAKYLAHRRWMLELDGPLFDLPFGALVVNADTGKDEPIYLVERAAIEAIPGALMLEPQSSARAAGGEFLGVGDAIYNGADPRYAGDRKKKQDVALSRLPGTSAELRECARAWGSGRARILTGADADSATVGKALRGNPAVIHFATHILTAPSDQASGLIALSLDRSGAMGLMGPTEIVANPVSTSLVVLNGCHSGEAEILPGSGLMGLTRAWIGAGARSVLATRWDLPDEAGETVMVNFYRAFRAHPEQGPSRALQQAQLQVLKGNSMRNSRNTAAIWAAYFLLGRE